MLRPLVSNIFEVMTLVKENAMRVLIFICLILWIVPVASADWLKIEPTTRVVTGITSDDPPQLSPFESAVKVADRRDIGNGPWKLDADNVTFLRPTAQDLEAFKDIIEPKRVQKREFFQALDSLDADANNRTKFRTFLQKMKVLMQ